MFAHIPGLYVVYPATPYDAKGMLKSAIRDNNPVLFVESQIMYNYKGVVPAEEYLIRHGKADVKRAGDKVSIITWGPMLYEALKAADTPLAQGYLSRGCRHPLTGAAGHRDDPRLGAQDRPLRGCQPLCRHR